MKMHSILIFALTMQASFATSFYIRPFSEFTKTTSNIIRGKISDIHVENVVTNEEGKTIYTYASLEIKDVIKGNITGTQIQVRKLGGSKDGVTLEIPSSVEFTEKEEGVFFLGDEQSDHSYEVSSLELGKFSLEQKNGEEILKGGIFSYSKPQPGHDHDVMASDIAENLKPWSINQLKELVKSQQQLITTSTETQKFPEVSKPLDVNKPDSGINPEGAEEKKSISEGKDNSPLYNTPTLWYSLAIIILTLGVFWFKRRG